MHPFDLFETTLRERFGGCLEVGSHRAPGPYACGLECAHAALGDDWSDTPDHWPDIRPLNDAFRDATLRTVWITRVLRAYWDWEEWTPTRQRAVLKRVVILTVQRLIAELPGLPEEVRVACREATTLAAADAARAAPDDAARDEIAVRACQLWIEAAEAQEAER